MTTPQPSCIPIILPAPLSIPHTDSSDAAAELHTDSSSIPRTNDPDAAVELHTDYLSRVPDDAAVDPHTESFFPPLRVPIRSRIYRTFRTTPQSICITDYSSSSPAAAKLHTDYSRTAPLPACMIIGVIPEDESVDAADFWYTGSASPCLPLAETFLWDILLSHGKLDGVFDAVLYASWVWSNLLKANAFR